MESELAEVSLKLFKEIGVNLPKVGDPRSRT